MAKKIRRRVRRITESALSLKRQFDIDFLFIDVEGLKQRIPDKQERLTYIKTLYEDLGRQLEIRNG